MAPQDGLDIRALGIGPDEPFTHEAVLFEGTLRLFRNGIPEHIPGFYRNLNQTSQFPVGKGVLRYFYVCERMSIDVVLVMK